MKLLEYRNKLKSIIASFLPDEAVTIADMLLCEALGVDRGTLLARLDSETPSGIDPFISGAVMQLSLGKPVQYVLGKCCFYGYDIAVGDGVFIPRSDTEIGVKAAEQLYTATDGAAKKAYVVNFLAEKGIQFDVETIDKLIEAAVLQLHHELYGSERA